MCNCVPKRKAYVQAKCLDMFSVFTDNNEYNGYVLNDIGIGGGDYIEFSYCLNCGKIEGNFPLPLTKLEKGE